ncbi:DUF433 domain-containing protein [Candidatus Gribaldobacteria bacterium]|nr:DUF433 domain-containing protein [Candidatus Gribaldobacteria bacterium]
MNKEITNNQEIMLGKPVIRGTRIPVYLILNLLEQGYDFNRIIKAYPELTKKKIQAALEYAQLIMRNEAVIKFPAVAA